MKDRVYHSDGVGISTPSDTDVLSGRGNACNFHPGNEYFRSLVKKHKVAYVACPKVQKSRFSRLIVDDVYSRNGRFLKQDPVTKLWYDIGDKKALDKTRQALREGAPDLLKGIQPENGETEKTPMPTLPPSSMGAISNAGLGFGVENYDGAGGLSQMHPVNTEDRLASGFVVEPPPPPPAAASMPVRPMQTASSTPVIQNRRRMTPSNAVPAEASIQPPSLASLPAHLVATAHLQTNEEMKALHKKLAKLCSPEQFEPTPINPNLQLSMQENTRLDTTAELPSSPRLQRSDSLEFEKIFDMSKSKPPKSSNGNMDELSQQLSTMSFSVGDIAAIQDEGNYSSLFDDSSPKVRESGKSASSGESGNNKSSRSGNNKNSLHLSSLANDMSISTFGGDSMGNLQAIDVSMQSFTHVFDESTDKV